ncbi:Phosphocarrier protein kinase/phosphorylase, nitrogen regulation associated [hydrothermal vent metagenome]|uniref:phosphoenolpyruvate--protein phosphotransferase n=1 Tax=hydrothermal vent metagenome TaxID=652676 RepID=A0A3B0T581_9ZZZZ
MKSKRPSATSPNVGPRMLLRRLREIMARPDSAQARLDQIVVLIAANMVAEVCSVYVAVPGDELELYATEGLNRSAVHQTRLRVGEGLVGTIAAEAVPLALADAQSHPAFAFRPETGEEIYHSFLGVPVLHSGRTIGVLVVQNVNPRTYVEDEVEALQITAMVIAETVATGDFGTAAAAAKVDPGHLLSLRRQGSALSGGIALGHAVLHEPRVVVNVIVSEDVEFEEKRLQAGLAALRLSVDEMLASTDLALGGEHRDVLEAYRMFAHDQSWSSKLEEAVRSGLTAEAAVERVQNETRARMLRQTNPYLRERLHDLDDLARRLLRHLAGKSAVLAAEDLPENAIIVARNMGPAELLDYDRGRLRGLIIEETSSTSHVAIVARALGVPAVGGFEGLADLVEPGDAVIVDGESGEVYLRPGPDVESIYSDKARFRARQQAQYAALRHVASVSRDGVPFELNINSGLLVDLPQLDQSGAAGIGLFRTELQFMIASRFPRFDEQRRHYTAVLDAAGDRPVVFRSLDIGSDKVLPYLRRPQEDNPALGWRALRMALDRPGLLRLQMRALIAAGVGRHLRIMFPLVADISEFRQAKALFEQELKRTDARGGKVPDKISLGVMIEVPSVLWMLDHLLSEVDFASVGSNDLIQFMFASDRGHPRLAQRYDPLNPSLLRALRAIVEAGTRARVPISLCGEMAGRPLEALALIGLGFRCISMAPASVGPVKAALLEADFGDIELFVATLLDQNGSSIRPQLAEYAARHEIGI